MMTNSFVSTSRLVLCFWQNSETIERTDVLDKCFCKCKVMIRKLFYFMFVARLAVLTAYKFVQVILTLMIFVCEQKKYVKTWLLAKLVASALCVNAVIPHAAVQCAYRDLCASAT